MLHTGPRRNSIPLEIGFDNERFQKLLHQVHPKKSPAQVIFSNINIEMQGCFQPIENTITLFNLDYFRYYSDAETTKDTLTEIMLHEIGHWSHVNRPLFLSGLYSSLVPLTLILLILVSIIPPEEIFIYPAFMVFACGLLLSSFTHFYQGREKFAEEFKKKMEKTSFAIELRSCFKCS